MKPPEGLKRLSPEAVATALRRAKQFRLLNDGFEAESICRDVLHVEPKNQEALATLILAITDQFMEGRTTLQQAQRLLPGLTDEYERAMHTGIVFERWAKARHRSGLPDAVTLDYFSEAMQAFEAAEKVRPLNNDDAILRWNSCLRLIHVNGYLERRMSLLGLPDEHEVEIALEQEGLE